MRFAPLFLYFALLASGPTRAEDPSPPIDPGSRSGTLSTGQEDLLEYKRKTAQRNENLNSIDRQEQQYSYGNRNANFQMGNLLIGQERAANMMRTLQDEHFRKALGRITSKGKQVLEENQSFQTPAAVLAGAASFWFGATLRLLKGESFRIHSRIEGRSRRAEFNLESPFLNGRVFVEGGTGFNLNLNRSIASINTTAEVNFISRTQSFSTEFRHPISPNLDFSIGATQIPTLNNRTDGHARILYHLDF